MSASGDLSGRVETFVAEVVGAMGFALDVALEEHQDHIRIVLEGEDGEWMVRRKGEALDALQHLVGSVFRRDVERGKRIVVDCLDFRKSKDRELRQMTRFLIEKARKSGLPQEIGPLNSYARRLVHLEVAEEPDMTSESIGDSPVKTVIIAPRSTEKRS